MLDLETQGISRIGSIVNANDAKSANFTKYFIFFRVTSYP